MVIRNPIRGFLVLAASLAAATISAHAEDSPLTGGTFTVQIENDKFTPGNTDKHYTNGFQLAWVSDKTEPDENTWARDLLQFLYPLAKVRAGRIGFSLGQTIYTPDDTDRNPPPADDRPYAGWLYVGTSLHAESTYTDRASTLDSVELTLGIVGPHAYGRQVQNEFHTIIGVDPSHGWDYQLHDEPALNMVFDRRWRPAPLERWGLQADAIPYVGGSVGNVFDYVGGGATLRIGQGLKNDYGPAHIQPALGGLEASDSIKGLWWYVFAGVEGRAVAHNIFLDGNTFENSPSVDRKWAVGDGLLGVAVAYDRYRLALTDVHRTKEFDGQNGIDHFAGINLSVHF